MDDKVEIRIMVTVVGEGAKVPATAIGHIKYPEKFVFDLAPQMRENILSKDYTTRGIFERVLAEAILKYTTRNK